ncbi:hypothetical protein KJ934_00190 [Patescibacteria group bacterium]|nr:hypothetical protein [Patescibacteria group bacterium]MBU4476953.1 hypothetical protein [Patescibacteria group bacterium]MCG2699027.1 hypothetical protein [Candidatus Parcubacteria bacterium]
MKSTWNIFSIILLILVGYFTADFIFVLGVNHGRELERNIEIIKEENTDQAELQRWEKRWEVSHGKKSFKKNQVDS